MLIGTDPHITIEYMIVPAILKKEPPLAVVHARYLSPCPIHFL